jgi:amino acid transporter
MTQRVILVIGIIAMIGSFIPFLIYMIGHGILQDYETMAFFPFYLIAIACLDQLRRNPPNEIRYNVVRFVYLMLIWIIFLVTRKMISINDPDGELNIVVLVAIGVVFVAILTGMFVSDIRKIQRDRHASGDGDKGAYNDPYKNEWGYLNHEK